MMKNNQRFTKILIPLMLNTNLRILNQIKEVNPILETKRTRVRLRLRVIMIEITVKTGRSQLMLEIMHRKICQQKLELM